MTDEQLAEIEKACAEATPDPWGYTYDGSSEWSIGQADDPQVKTVAIVRDRTDERARRDVPFIARARSWVPALIDEVRRLRALQALFGASERKEGRREGAEQLQRFADAIMDAQWAEGRGHLEETGCPWCHAAPYSGEEQHEEGCVVLEAAAIRALAKGEGT